MLTRQKIINYLCPPCPYQRLTGYRGAVFGTRIASAVSLITQPASPCLHIVEQAGKEGIEAEGGFMTGEDELAPCAGEGHIELAVHFTTLLSHTVGGQEIELVTVGDGEAVDDDVALAPLITLDGVDADVA